SIGIGVNEVMDEMMAAGTYGGMESRRLNDGGTGGAPWRVSRPGPYVRQPRLLLEEGEGRGGGEGLSDCRPLEEQGTGFGSGPVRDTCASIKGFGREGENEEGAPNA
ncbi:hypothetical protein NHX12_017565, partial [Muraenolepis orangiensis]